MTFTVGLAQVRPVLGDVEANLGTFREAVREAKARGCDLLVTPELGLTGYTLRDMVPVVAMHDGHAGISEVTALSRDLALLVGYVEESAHPHFYNTALFCDEGARVHRHRKVYLPTYGMFDERRYFTSGEALRAFDTRLGRFGVLICEDAWHLSAGYVLAMDGADVLFNLANSPARGITTDERPDTVRAWENLNRTYATYFCSYLVFCNRVGTEDGVTFWGGSEVLDPEGKVVAKAKYFEEDFITAEIDEDAIRRARMYTPVAREERLHLTLRELERVARERAGDEPEAPETGGE